MADERYDGFLSYSHAVDGRLAPALQTGVERFAKRWNRIRALRIFRDKTSLAADPSLWQVIERALARSAWFVLVASPEAAASVWVGREVDWWLRHRGSDSLLIVVADGDLCWNEELGGFDPVVSTALPPALCGAFRAEPLWVDARWARSAERLSMVNPDLQDAVADIASTISGVPKDELVGTAIREHRRTMRLARSAQTTLAILLVAAVIAAVVAVVARNEAADQARVAIHQRDVAASNQVAVQSARVTDPVLSRLQSVAAWRINPSPESRYAMEVAAARADVAVLAGHSGWVLGVAFTPDGRLLASSGDDNTIRLWDVVTHRQVGDAFTADAGPVLALTVSPDGKTIATGGTESDVRLWDVASRRLVATLQAKARYVGSVAFSPDGRMLANSNGDGSALLWDLATRKRVARLVGHPGHSGSVELAFSPDSRTLASAADTVRLWDTASQRPLGGPLTGHTEQVSALQFSPDGRTLATSAETVRLWDVATRHQAATLSSGKVNSIDFTSDGRLLATGDTDGLVRIWDTSTRRQVGGALGPSGIGPLAFSPDGAALATAGYTGVIRLWNTARVVGTPIQGHSGPVNVVAYSPDGRTIATAGDDRTLRFWDAATRKRIGVPLTGHTGPIVGAAYSPDGTLVATTSGDGSLRLWDTRTHRQKRIVATEPGVYVSTAFSPDGTTLAIAGEDGPVRLVHIDDGDSIPVAGADNPIVTVSPDKLTSGAAGVWVAFSPDGRTVAAAYGDEVRLWDTATREQLGEPFTGHAGLLTALAFSPDGKTLATGSKDQTVRLWSVASHRLIGTPLTGHSDTVTALAFSRDGATLASAAGDVRLWDVTTRQQIGTSVTDDDESVTALAFSADGATLATASRHGHTRLWNLTYLVDDLPGRLCTEAGRALTREEWAQYVPSGPRYRQVCS